MKITKETTLCISIAARPGNFGTTFFNAAFDRLNLDYLYKAMSLHPEEGDLKSVIGAIRALNIRGCGVSMPFKEKVVPLLDRLDPMAQKIGAVNTIVNEKGILTGYNTDFEGTLRVVSKSFPIEGKKVLVVGAGGMARAVLAVLSKLGGKISVTSRDKNKLQIFAKETGATIFSWENLQNAAGYLLVNATSCGMVPNAEEMVVSEKTIASFEAVLDVVAQPAETLLVRTARALGKKVVTGVQITVEQAVCQFELYTGQKFPRSLLKENNFKPKAFVLDVDGVMTTGQFFYSPEGKAFKVFGPDDHDGLSLLKKHMVIHFVTGDRRGFEITKKRVAEDMKFPLDLVSTTKRHEWIAGKWDPKTVIYMGDGIFDHYVFAKVGYGISPANGFYVAKDRADYVTKSSGGDRAVAEACLHILDKFFDPYNPERDLESMQGSGEWTV